MTHEQARWGVALALEAFGMDVWERRTRAGAAAGPDLIVQDPTTGAFATLRVMAGKRPRGDRPGLYFDRRRLGRRADVLALVEPTGRGVAFRPATEWDAPDHRANGASGP